jgi:GDP-4-dehydro-6-deoxy-D-mannose reductase
LPKRIIITGCEGFIGSHLADLLVDKDLMVYGMVYGGAGNIRHLKDRITLLECDLKDRQRVREVIDGVKPDIIFHLAAQSFVTLSWEDPEETLKTNVLGTFYLMDSIREAGIAPLIEIVGSSSVYGPRDTTEMPLGAEGDFKPSSMYAVSKVSEEMLGYFYWKVYGMKVIRIRPFNMTGPRKTFDACSDFAKGIAEIEKGLKESLEVGNLDTVRDFTDGRDAVKALWLLTEKGELGEVYNLCSAKAYKMDEILTKLIAISGREINCRITPEKMRPFDDPIYVGDNTRLRSLGWEPQIPIEKTLSDLLDYWRKHLSEA